VECAICGIINGMFTSSVFKMSMSWRSIFWSFDTEWNTLFTVQ